MTLLPGGSWTKHCRASGELRLFKYFGPGPEAAAEGRSAGQGVCFLLLSPQTSDLVRKGRRRGARVDVKIAFYTSHRRLRAWPGWGGGGSADETGSLLFIVFTNRPLLRAWPGGHGEGAYGQRVFISAPRADGGLAGRTASVAGPGGSCWRSQECSAPSPSPVLCCRLCLTFTRKKKTRHGKEWPDTLLSPPGQLARRERHVTGGAPTAAAERHHTNTLHRKQTKMIRTSTKHQSKTMVHSLYRLTTYHYSSSAIFES